jgi:hypothetical protein
MIRDSLSRFKFNAYKGLGNTCPVCASSSGKCRWQNYELSAKNGKTTPTIKTLCMTGAGGYGNPDYHYFNDTRDGQWGVYIPLVDWNEHRGEDRQATPAEREEWVKNQQLKREALLEAENQRRAESLPALERDIAARAILAQLSLNEIDRKDLIRRGFTQQQIREIGFKSVEKFQRLTEPVNNRFPGVNIQGNRLSNGSISGILIPLYTVTGEIVAFQVRNREQSKSRYRWLSSVWEKGRDNGASPSLPNGENPLTFAYPQLLGVIPVTRSIVAHIEELIKHSHGVVALDAYLSDTELDFLRKLRQFNFVHKLENTYRNQMNVRMVNQKSTLTRAILDDALTGANLLITATTQKHCENLEKSLIRIGIPEACICRIDGTTDRDDTVGLFFRNPKAYLEQHRPQIVILSPTAESGISIDLVGYFRTHYHFHLGNLGILSGLQFLGRYRDFSAPRVIYCERQGRIGDGNSSSFTKWVKDEFDRQVHEDMNLVFMLLDNGSIEEAVKMLANYANKEDLWLKLAHQYKASLNEEMKYLRELFVEAMVADGYTVSIDPEDIDTLPVVAKN